MPNFEEAFLEIRRYLSLWATEVKLANASGYFNINKISESTAMSLLNLVFELELRDLNREKSNYPGVDLGDDKVGKLAFQVTSQTDNSKLLGSLNTFVTQNYGKRYPNGIRFFIIGNRIKKSKNTAPFSKYLDIFDHNQHIYYLDDLIEIIEDIYHNDEKRFNKIKALLEREFGISSPLVAKPVIDFNSASERYTFYKRLIVGKYRDTANNFVQFDCKLNGTKITSNELSQIVRKDDGLLIIGPSGCGKSMLSRMLAINFLDDGVALIFESKYYDSDLGTLLEKSITPFGFNSITDLFGIARELDLQVLMIFDGINECDIQKRPKLLLEIEKIKLDHKVKILLSDQQYDPLFGSLNLPRIDINFPSFETKRAITGKYSGKMVGDKFDLILETISTSMEAKMLGEITAENIDRMSRFTLFEVFIRQKLGAVQADGFEFMSHIASILSEEISFSIPERKVEEILRSNALPYSIYENCIEAKILERTMGKTSFYHEMFYDFFVVESIIRFSPTSKSILTHLNAPKNYDKKSLIIGAITDISILNEVLAQIIDVNLLNALYEGEAGEFVKNWAMRKVVDTIEMAGKEIEGLRYELTNNEIDAVSFVEETLTKWTDQEYAFIKLIPYRLSEGEYILEFSEVIEKMDKKMLEQIKELKEACRSQQISASSAVFVATYQSHSQKKSAISSIMEKLHSGFLRFDDGPTFPKEALDSLSDSAPINVGKFFFIVVLLRYRDELQQFYPYVLDLIKNKWRSTPHPLLFAVLDSIYFFPRNEAERQALIDGLDEIQGQTTNAWLSTSIFDALSAMGALEEDTERHISVAEHEIDQVISEDESDENCKEIFSLYCRQFDHPYSNAYHTAILNLTKKKKDKFFRMALKGLYFPFFGATLLSDAFKMLEDKMCPLIVRLTEVPITDRTIPQDAFQLFLMSHIILGKFNYPLVSRFKEAADLSERSLYAAAELCYWHNRTDLEPKQLKASANKAVEFLFEKSNCYTIDTLRQYRYNIAQITIRKLFERKSVVLFEESYKDLVVKRSIEAIENLGGQKPIKSISFNDDPNIHAIDLLQQYGDASVIEPLKNLSGHPKYGKDAVKAIKKLSTSNQ
ncbi:SMEK domain-containing protein [Pedobacter sp.]